MKPQLFLHGALPIVREARALIICMRPSEWIKNLFVATPLFFAGSATFIEKSRATSLALIAFCLVSSAIYILNDICDRRRDQSHPLKRTRPLASGELGVPVAAVAAVLCWLSGLAIAAFNGGLLLTLLAYTMLNVAYSLRLKHIVILDILCIAIGFVLRVFAGGFAANVDPSAWLVIMTFLLSVVLALGKRRHELNVTAAAVGHHRPVLEEYSVPLVDELLAVVTPATLITYILYTMDPTTLAHFHSRLLYLTTGFVVFGIFRYLYLIHRRALGGSPAELLVTDPGLAMTVVAWIGTFALMLYA